MGIDPGINGAIVVIDNQTGIPNSRIVMPTFQVEKKKSGEKTSKKNIIDIPALFKYLSEQAPYIKMAFLEQVSARPGQGVTSMFRFGEAYGIIQALLTATLIPYRMVTPQSWVKYMHAGLSKDIDSKDRSKIIVNRLYPTIDLRATEKSKVPHEGIVDALLIAEHGRTILT